MKASEQNKSAFNVLDGEALVHRIKWPKKAISTYNDIAVICATALWTQLCNF